jgi:hypothetical protein
MLHCSVPIRNQSKTNHKVTKSPLPHGEGFLLPELLPQSKIIFERFIGIETAACPSFTKGKFTYDLALPEKLHRVHRFMLVVGTPLAAAVILANLKVQVCPLGIACRANFTDYLTP